MIEGRWRSQDEDFPGTAYGTEIAGASCCGKRRPEMRNGLSRFAIEEVATRYTVSGQWSDVSEIIVTGPAKEPFAVVRDLLNP